MSDLCILPLIRWDVQERLCKAKGENIYCVHQCFTFGPYNNLARFHRQKTKQNKNKRFEVYPGDIASQR